MTFRYFMKKTLLTAGLVFITASAFPRGAFAETVIPSAAEDADSYVVVHSDDGVLGFREGPGSEYPSAGPAFRNGDVLHITRTVTASSGNPWGLTTDASGSVTGWVALLPTDPATPAQITSYMEAAASSRIEQQMSALNAEQAAQTAANPAETQPEQPEEHNPNTDTQQPAPETAASPDNTVEAADGTRPVGSSAMLENVGQQELQNTETVSPEPAENPAGENKTESETKGSPVVRVLMALLILLLIGLAFFYVRSRNRRKKRRYTHSVVRRR